MWHAWKIENVTVTAALWQKNYTIKLSAFQLFRCYFNIKAYILHRHERASQNWRQRVFFFYRHEFRTARFHTNKDCMWLDWQAWSSWAWQQSTHERKGWRDGVVRAGRRAGDEQKHTLGSCCSQQQVQREGWWWGLEGGVSGFVERRKRACEGGEWVGLGNIWVAFTESNSAPISQWDGDPAWGPINGIPVWFCTAMRLFHYDPLNLGALTCERQWGRHWQQQEGSHFAVCCPLCAGKKAETAVAVDQKDTSRNHFRPGWRMWVQRFQTTCCNSSMLPEICSPCGLSSPFSACFLLSAGGGCHTQFCRHDIQRLLERMVSRALKIVQRKFYIPALNSGVRQKCVFSCE